MTMRKKYSVSILVLLLMAALCVCLFACEEGIDGLPQSEEDLVGAAIGITIHLHDVHGPNSGAARTITATETTSLSRNDFDAEYYECTGVYDHQGTLLYDFNEGWTVNVFDESFSSSFGNELELWLRWQAETIRLRFDADGIDPMTIEYGSSLQTLSVPDYEGSDYLFDGWLNDGALIADKRGTVLIDAFDASHCAIRYGVVSLTPRLVKRTSTVVFTNTLQDKTVSKTYDYGYALSASDYPRVEEAEHREFVGWSTSPLEYVPQTEPLRAASVPLYTIWKKFTTLTFLEGDELYASKRVYEGEVLNLETYDGLNREGYEVEGVYINRHFSGNAEVSYPYGEDKSFYVRWERVYDVTFYEGENHLIGTRKVRQGDKLIPHYYELIKGTENEGHQASGLYRSPAFEGASVVSYSVDQGISSLYVKRKDGISACVFYHSNYPKVASLAAAVKTTYADDGSESDWAGSQFRCRGWLFAGWATSGSGAVKYVNGQSIGEVAQDGVINLYAVWKVVPTEVGQYVPTGSVVSDTDGGPKYTVYNTIDSTPWNLADYAIVDWRNESDTVVGKHTKRVVNDKRYNNIDICTNTKQVYFIGASNKTFTDFHFHLVSYTSRDWLNVVFVNFRYETAADGALKTWWASDHSDKNANLRLTLIGDNAIGSSCASGDLIYQMTHMIVDGSGTLVLRAGKGADASGAGTKGGDGGVAIRATLLEVALDATGKLTVYGGAGGAGAEGDNDKRGGDGGAGGTGIQCVMFSTQDAGTVQLYGGNGGSGGKGGNGSMGSRGGDGGNGGDGAVPVECSRIQSDKQCLLVCGNGGAGGAGGKGGEGQVGSMGLSKGYRDGGAGGNGGNGGHGGNAGFSIQLIENKKTAKITLDLGVGGTGGKGGNGGRGGNGGPDVGTYYVATPYGRNGGDGGAGGKGGNGGCGQIPGEAGSAGKSGNGGSGTNKTWGFFQQYNNTGSNGKKPENLGPGFDGTKINLLECNGNFYTLILLPLDWDEAKAYCESLGGHLATITSEGEQAFLESFANGNYWLGATDRETEGAWKWVTGEAWSYTHWRSGEPNNDNDEDYLGTFPQEWNDYKKTSSGIVGFVCEWEPTTLNGHYYARFDVSLSWDDAKAYCESLGGHLATITSKEEDTFVQKLAPSGGCWVGATDRETEGTWEWITGETWSYTNWGSGEPNNANSGEDALEFHSSYWNDNNESRNKPFICEWDS